MDLTVAGRRAYAYTGGKPFDPALPCLVFIHGALHDHSVWTLLARWFAHHGYGVLAVDQPGHRRSAGPPLASIEAIADWVLALIDAAGVGRAALIGHSMGSLIALEVAAQAPSRVSRLLMLGTAYPMAVSPALLEAARAAPQRGMDLVNALSISSTAVKPGVPGPGTWTQGANRQLMALVQASPGSANVFEHDFRLCDAYRHGLEAAALRRCPVDLIVGEADQMTPARATAALAAALQARVTTLPGGHALMQEQPDPVLQALRRALVDMPGTPG
jgi:pimeloyl-ACP methyl ester carboxylesterase